MKILLINTADNYGGAAIASLRLAETFMGLGHEVKMLVREKKGSRDFVIGQLSGLSARIAFLKQNYAYFKYLNFTRASKAPLVISTNEYGKSIHENELVRWADALHFNWINNSFLRIKDLDKLLQLNKKIYWHCHDLWPMTGACHHPIDCTNYTKGCGNCPYIKSSGPNDISAKLFNQKLKLYAKKNIHFVFPSPWIYNKIQDSPLSAGQSCSMIYNPIDTQLFSHSKRFESKKKLRLNPGKKYILLGAANTALKIKGAHLFEAALQHIKAELKDTELLVFGKSNSDWLNSLPIPYKNFGHLSQSDVITLYKASDAFAFPSMVESFGYTAVEAQACGTPLISFGAGITQDLIEHKSTGFLAEMGNTKAFAEGILWVLNNAAQLKPEALHQAVANKFSYQSVGEAYAEIL